MNPRSDRPRILLLVDERDWAFGILANAIQIHLGNRFAFQILATADRPVIDDRLYDIIHVFFECEEYHKPFLHGNSKLLKGVYSHRWQLEGLSAQEFYNRHLREAHAVVVPNVQLLRSLRSIPPAVHLVPEGVDTTLFSPGTPRTDSLVVGWVGNPGNDIKRFSWMQKACKGICELRIAGGGLTQEQMADFYRRIDVIACCSKAEGTPRPLLEGMASGAFPLCFDVGVARELIEHGINGIVPAEESIHALRRNIQWCKKYIGYVRSTGYENSERIRATRSWQAVLPRLAGVYESLL